MSELFRSSNVVAQIRHTKALVKFCTDHGYNLAHLETINSCLDALEEENIALAYDFYSRVPLGGNGCFNDWWPPVVFDHENEDYVWAVFEGLVSQWRSSMELSKKISSS